MSWRFEDIQTFLDVMETGSITAAAARLNVSKSVVSKRVADLEAALGAALFQRSARKLIPTSAAHDFFERAQPLVRGIVEVAESVADRRRGLRGTLRIAAPMSFGTMHLSRVVADFAALHSDLQVVMELDDRMIDLVNSGYDVGIRIGILKDSSLIARKLCDDPRVVCCSPAFADRHGLPQSLDDLARFPCIDYANVSTGQLWQFEGGPGGHPVHVVMQGRVAANNGEAMRDMAIAGLGLTLLPMFIVADALREGLLLPVLPQFRPLAYTIFAVYPPTRQVPAKVRAFIDHLARHITEPPLWRFSIPRGT